jgi:PiT family inorganic phosphate transporter
VKTYFGIASSSSHALIGGFFGAAVAKAGWGALVATGLIKITLFIVLAPVLGMALGFVLMVTTVDFSERSPEPGGRALPEAPAGIGGPL